MKRFFFGVGFPDKGGKGFIFFMLSGHHRICYGSVLKNLIDIIKGWRMGFLTLFWEIKMKKTSQVLKSLILALGVLFLGSCKLKVDGDLSVLEDFTLRKGDQTYTYSADDYEASMKLVSNRTKLRMTIKEGEQSRKFYFTIPEGTELPRWDGEVFVPAADNGQDYDMLANVSTVESRSEDRWGCESCTYQEQVWRCYGGTCGWYSETVWGQRSVHYYVKYFDTSYTLNFSAPQSSEETASFQGERQSFERWYHYRDPWCRRYCY